MAYPATLLALVFFSSKALAASNFGGLDATTFDQAVSRGMSNEELAKLMMAAQQTSASTSSAQSLFTEIHNEAKTMSVKFNDLGMQIAMGSSEITNELFQKSGELSNKANSMLLDVQKMIQDVDATVVELNYKIEQDEHQSTALLDELITKLSHLEGSLAEISDSKTTKNIHRLVSQTTKDRNSIYKMLAKRRDKMSSNAEKIKKSLYKMAEKLEQEFYSVFEKLNQSIEYESETSELMISMMNEISSRVHERIGDTLTMLEAQTQSGYSQASAVSNGFAENLPVSSVPPKRRRQYNQATGASVNHFTDLET